MKNCKEKSSRPDDDKEFEIIRIGTIDDSEPYLWIGEKDDGKMIMTLTGKQLLKLGEDIVRAFGLKVTK